MAHLSPRTRLRAEAVAAALTGLLAVVTIFVPDWIEVVSGADPDHGDGSIEVLIVLALAVVSAVLGGLAWRTRRRIQGA